MAHPWRLGRRFFCDQVNSNCQKGFDLYFPLKYQLALGGTFPRFFPFPSQPPEFVSVFLTSVLTCTFVGSGMVLDNWVLDIASTLVKGTDLH
jgi:hypothetical protein